jgi:predicted lipoprotein with Yx(FWY)xxD motif
MLKQIEETTQAVVDESKVTFEKDMGDGITLYTLCNSKGNVEACSTNFSELWNRVLANPEMV